MVDPFAMVKVGNSECGFLKLTPLSRTSAIAGAVCGVTIRPRNPSGTNRMRLRGVLFCASAVPADSVIRPADNKMIARRIEISPSEANLRPGPLPLFSFAVRQNCYIRSRTVARQLYALRNPAAWASSGEQNQRSGLVIAG